MNTEITLECPFQRGEQRVEKVSIVQPSGTGWLRDVKLSELLQMDADALTTVLPRLTSPALTEHDIRNKLDAGDFVRLGEPVIYFLLPKSKRAEIDAARETPTPESATA